MLQIDGTGAEAISKGFVEKGITNFQFILDEGTTVLDGVLEGIDSPLALWVMYTIIHFRTTERHSI